MAVGEEWLRACSRGCGRCGACGGCCRAICGDLWVLPLPCLVHLSLLQPRELRAGWTRSFAFPILNWGIMLPLLLLPQPGGPTALLAAATKNPTEFGVFVAAAGGGAQAGAVREPESGGPAPGGAQLGQGGADQRHQPHVHAAGGGAEPAGQGGWRGGCQVTCVCQFVSDALSF